MLSPVSSHSFFPSHIHEQGGKSSSSKGRFFSINWDKTHILGNLIMTIGAVAYAYFNKLPPLVMIGFGVLGIVTLMSYGAALRSRPSRSEIDYLQEQLETERANSSLKESIFKDKIKGSDVGEKFLEIFEEKEVEFERLGGQIARRRATIASLEREIAKLKAKHAYWASNADPE